METNTIKYKTIYDVKIHHTYFLDQGEDKFSSWNDTDIEDSIKIKKTLVKYNVHQFLSIRPTIATKQLLLNYRVILRNNNQGFKLLMATDKDSKPIVSILKSIILRFEIYRIDPLFLIYTKKTKPLFDGIYIIGKNNIKKQLNTQGSMELYKTINEENDMNRSIHKSPLSSHIKLISIDRSLSLDQKKTKSESTIKNELKTQISKGLYGYINLKTYNTDLTNDLIEINWVFKSTESYWRYLNNIKDEQYETSNMYNLTKNGNTEITNAQLSNPKPTEDRKYPNPTPSVMKKEGNKIYSEINI